MEYNIIQYLYKMLNNNLEVINILCYELLSLQLS